MSEPILSLDRVSKSFGGLAVLRELSFDVNQGETESLVLGLIGPNGAGKTTVFNLISGLTKPDSGTIRFKGRKINGLAPEKISRLGIARTYQIPQPFSNLTVRQNLLVASRYGASLGADEAEKQVSQVLDMTGLSDKEVILAGYLTLLDRKRLELARALSNKPSLLLMDEIASGLTEAEIPRLLEILQTIRKVGITTLLIEHSIQLVTKSADLIVVIDGGSKLAEGKPKEIVALEEVIEAYLGKAVV